MKVRRHKMVFSSGTVSAVEVEDILSRVTAIPDAEIHLVVLDEEGVSLEMQWSKDAIDYAEKAVRSSLNRVYFAVEFRNHSIVIANSEEAILLEEEEDGYLPIDLLDLKKIIETEGRYLPSVFTFEGQRTLLESRRGRFGKLVPVALYLL